MPINNTHLAIKQLRLKNDWKQEYVASAMNISIAAYSKIESGITDINLSRLEQIANLYEITLVELVSNQTKVDLNELENLKAQLFAKNLQIMDLQSKVIELYKRMDA